MSAGRVFSGANLDAALSAACGELRARVGEIRYETVADDNAEGVAINAVVDPVAVLGLFLSEMFRAGELELRVSLSEDGDVLRGEVEGEDSRLLTGSGGKPLDALQYLVNRVLDNRAGEHPPVQLDVDGFKERRARSLRQQAEEAADRVARRGRPVTFPLMSPAARRVIHVALATDDRVETESQGDGFLKRLVVRPRRRR